MAKAAGVGGILNSGPTEETAQPNELLVANFGAGVEQAATPITLSGGLRALTPVGFMGVGPLALYPAFRIVSERGRYSAGATLPKSGNWTAVVVTYKGN